MTIRFFPSGLPPSSSYAVSASYSNTLLGPTPVTASSAQYSINFVGPSGPPAVTVNASGFNLP
jgi:hypothetical protein